MHTAVRSILILFFSLSAVHVLPGCRPAPPAGDGFVCGPLPDGTYEGTSSSWPNRAAVRVTVKDGRIADVEILRRWASWIGRKAERVIPNRIVERQSTQVDAVTGATNSSRVIMNAAQNALQRACGPP